MPTYIVKPAPDSGDYYVAWSTVVEAPVAFGDRAYLKANPPYACETDDERFDRADRTGSSALWPTAEDPYLRFGEGFIYMQRGWLVRENLAEACRRLAEDENDTITDLLKPFEDETEVRPA